MRLGLKVNCDALVSVIVPVFNMEKYLASCLDSICGQTYKSLEIIVIDDGSTDHSLDICRQYSEMDNRICVYSKKNGGVASARSTGLSKANGEYVIHADPDDQLPLNAIETLVKGICAHRADICIGNYLVKYPNKEILKRVKKSQNAQVFLSDLVLNHVHGALWNKLIRRDLCQGIDFVPGVDLMEDKVYISRLLINNIRASICYVDEVVYIYYQRSGSYVNALNYRYVAAFENANAIILKLVAPVLGGEVMRSAANKLRVICMMESPLADLKRLKEDVLILRDKNISFHFRVVVWFFINGFKSPLLLLRFIRNFRNKLRGLY
ncbi:glycosyltransferase family 2 protein [Stutzerimonas stutzeri]|uniref:glycosyltransferase family 2 protein n=1 Tax=Stutzerimonas stutzeri TaxID=316 RepID=UPI003211C003